MRTGKSRCLHYTLYIAIGLSDQFPKVGFFCRVLKFFKVWKRSVENIFKYLLSDILDKWINSTIFIFCI